MCHCHNIIQYFLQQHRTHEHEVSPHANAVLHGHQHKGCGAESVALSSSGLDRAVLQ